MVLFPLLAVIGITGFYLTNESLFDTILAETPRQAASLPPGMSMTIDREEAVSLAQKIWPTRPITRVASNKYQHKSCWSVEFNKDRVFVEVATGTHHVVEKFQTRSYAFDGTHLGDHWNWGRLMKQLHTGNILGKSGVFVADLLSISLLVFSFSGFYLWLAPRLRRWKRRE
ncbi:MAG: PepSY domain-containing protein [Magnetococcales bacterium]|nr:PepSY domain-containing protein [Magnetococcales bacterium]